MQPSLKVRLACLAFVLAAAFASSPVAVAAPPVLTADIVTGYVRAGIEWVGTKAVIGVVKLVEWFQG